MKYRAEIDGLRALAVVPVVLFHAGFELFSGGFIGVDVFFVISGYLITTILIDDIENNRFSIIDFYKRRARRILPALFAVMLATIPFAWAWMMPSQMKDFSQSLVAVCLFVSNVLFWHESGYFSEDSEQKPLLHTWSLAVEEQYYVLFPIFLLFAWRFGKGRTLWMIVTLSFISLGLSEWGSRINPSANFYLIHSRAWELLAGSITAFIVHKREVQANNFLSLAGLATLTISIFAYDETIPFPSIYALVPVVAVVLIVLYAQRGSYVANLLSNRIFVGIGLVSYSLYLWHQPVLAFNKVRFGENHDPIILGTLIAFTFALSVLSWKYIEQPFRTSNYFRSTKKIFSFSIAGILLFVTAGSFGYFSGGMTSRVKFLPDENTSEAQLKHILDEWPYCCKPDPKSLYKDALTGFDRIGYGDTKKVLWVGDSHTGHYLYGIEHYFEQNNMISTHSSLFQFWAGFPTELEKLKLDKDPEIDTIVFSMFWAKNYGNNYVIENHRDKGAALGQIKTASEMDMIDDNFRDVFSSLKNMGKDVFIILDNPIGNEGNPMELIDIIGTTVKPAEVHIPTKTEMIRRLEPSRSRLINLARELDLKIIDPLEYLCDESYCPVFSEDGRLIYTDFDHLSNEASIKHTAYIYGVFH